MSRETLDRPAPPQAAPVAQSVRPVMLLTLNVELEEPAIAFAIDSAGQTGAELWICDAIPLEYRNYVLFGVEDPNRNSFGIALTLKNVGTIPIN